MRSSLCQLPESADGAADSGSSGGRNCPCSSGDNFSARTTFPDANSRPLHGVLAAESASVPCVLSDLHLLHLLTEGGTITSSVLSGNANLFRAFRHFLGKEGWGGVDGS